MESGRHRINILVVGLLSSGSSALVDLLSEYSNIHVIPNEFDDFRAPGLVADQLSFQQCRDFPSKIDILVKNKSIWKLTYKVIPVLKWENNKLSFTRFGIRDTLIRIKQLYYLRKLNEKLKLDYSLEEKVKFANHWITQIGNINSNDRKKILFNQPINIALDPDIWKKVFNPYKLIIVYRNPKDQLADIIERGYLSASYNGPMMTIAGINIESLYGRNRKGAIKFHIDALKKRMEWVDNLKSKLKPDEFLLLDFEGLINEYENYKIVIENFIGDLKGTHLYKYKYFDPNKSKKYIGIYTNTLKDSELELLSELDSWYKNMIIKNHINKDIHYAINNKSLKSTKYNGQIS